MVYNIFMDTSNVNIKILPKTPQLSGNTNAQQIVTAPVALDSKAQQQLLKAKCESQRSNIKSKI